METRWKHLAKNHVQKAETENAVSDLKVGEVLK